ncbi:OmpH family outer membrane protein [Natroniella sulfidigena]|uniref:OmpH family outer membrane protein n=1 Tax=Natroniella sulfidigena TaxID=723921 RepID=UPI00200ACB31|nr:OmpH family outer membrane protein [Natroniella sulfidigena]MCK8817645.1 OmpH family outer membrane protein [Natroniella sulfidigena]
MSKKRVLIGALVLLLAVGSIMINLSSEVRAEASKIGYVDLEEVYEVHPEVARLQQTLEAEAQELQAEFQQEMGELDPEQDQEEMQQLQQQFQQQFNQIQEGQWEEIEQQIQPDLDQARKELGLDLIVNQEVVVNGGQDVTEEIKDYFENL